MNVTIILHPFTGFDSKTTRWLKEQGVTSEDVLLLIGSVMRDVNPQHSWNNIFAVEFMHLLNDTEIDTDTRDILYAIRDKIFIVTFGWLRRNVTLMNISPHHELISVVREPHTHKFTYRV